MTADQDYESLELYLQQAKDSKGLDYVFQEEIGLVFGEDCSKNLSPEVTIQNDQTSRNNVSVSLYEQDQESCASTQKATAYMHDTFRETCSESEALHYTTGESHSSNTIEVTYDVTFKHDVTFEQDVFLTEDDRLPASNDTGHDEREINDIIGLYGHVGEETNRNYYPRIDSAKISSQTDDHGTCYTHFTSFNEACSYNPDTDSHCETTNGKTNAAEIASRDYVYRKDGTWQGGSNSDYGENEDPSGGNSFENVVLKIKDFLSDRFKDVDHEPVSDISEEYLTADTESGFNSHGPDRYTKEDFGKQLPRGESTDTYSSSENDIFLSELSNLESDFSDSGVTGLNIRPVSFIPGERMPILSPGEKLTDDKTDQYTGLLNSDIGKSRSQKLTENNHALSSLIIDNKQLSNANISDMGTSLSKPIDAKEVNSHPKNFEGTNIHEILDFASDGINKPKTRVPSSLSEVGSSFKERKDLLVKELKDDEMKTRSVIDSVRATNFSRTPDAVRVAKPQLIFGSSELNSVGSQDYYNKERVQKSSSLKTETNHLRSTHSSNIPVQPVSYTGLEDLENLINRSLQYLNCSLNELDASCKTINARNENSISPVCFERTNKHFKVLEISSASPANYKVIDEKGTRMKGRSLSVPEISFSNIKTVSEDDIPAEMIVNPNTLMSSSYNENWNSNVFKETNRALTEQMLAAHNNSLKEDIDVLNDLTAHREVNHGVNSKIGHSDRQLGYSLSREAKAREHDLEYASDSLHYHDTKNTVSSSGRSERWFTKFKSETVLGPTLEFSNAVKMDGGNSYIHKCHSAEELEPPAIPESLDRKERITLSRKMKHPVTPPPPSADRSDITINGTLSLDRKLKPDHVSLDGLQATFHTKNTDTTMVKENGLNFCLDSKLNRKSGSDIDCHKSKNGLPLFRKSDVSLSYEDKNKALNNNNEALSQEEELKQLLDACNIKTDELPISKPKINITNTTEKVPVSDTKATNVSDTVRTIPKIQVKSPSITDDRNKITDNLASAAKDNSDSAIESSSLINGGVQTEDSKVYQGNLTKLPYEIMQSEGVIKSLEYDHSPEMQVMFNSLSPVLLRRNSSKKPARKHGSYSSESSPETEKRVDMHQRLEALKPVVQTLSVEQETGSSLFMDPKMSQTWHGATSANWSQIYGPQMREMMRLHGLSDTEWEHDNEVSTRERDFTQGSKTLPSSKSLLDEMHKRFCADQYDHKAESEMARALVLLRLKSNTSKLQKPAAYQAKRSASFNIKMGTGSAGSDSSPLLPRSPNRIRIKTSPKMKYPSSIRREKTPEPLTFTKDMEKGTRKEEAEIEAVEACRWLKETGFPQYAQMYEDGQFPVDVDSVEKDHDFLDKEDIQSLFRRLNTLNKCAIMKIGTPTKKELEDSEDEDECALSDKWKYQRSSRRWSRKDLNSPLIENVNSQPVLKSASSHDSLLADQNTSSETDDSPVLISKMHHTTADDMVLHRKNLTVDANGNATMKLSPKIRRVASERIKSAKSILKRVESLKGRKSRKNKNISDISGPVINDAADMQAKIKHLNCKDINSHSPSKEEIIPPSSPTIESRLQANSDTSANSSRLASPDINRTGTSLGNESFLLSSRDKTADSGVLIHSANSTFSESDTSAIADGALGFSPISQQSETSRTSLDNTFSSDYRPGRFPTNLDDSLFSETSVRTRSFSYVDDSSEHNSVKSRRRGSCDPRHDLHRVSIYDNVPIEEDLSVAQQELDIILSELFQNINGLNRAINGDDAETLHPPTSSAKSSSSLDGDAADLEHAIDRQSDSRDNEVTSGTLSSPDTSDHEFHVEDLSHDDSAEHIECRERRDSGVGSSLTRTNSVRKRYRIRWHSFQKSHRPTSHNRNLQLCNLSAGQILVLRKLSLLKLTALLEKYSPNKSGWSLTVPRFMKRHKVPDYKGKNVFGVPFTVMIQRTGQALPQCVLHAMRFLRRNCGDALGIFRKSGVRSRIQKLRNDIEADPENISFEELQAYDVADLVKQYFRELPECLLTNKLSDIFISIFIYMPAEIRLEAMQAALVLMVDENRDVLQSLLLFLSDIAQYASEHQMTASNLAVCFGPSLFSIGGFRHPNQTPSPRRNRKNPGIPDARELMEQKAAHECLTLMIEECKRLFTIPAGTISKCRCWHGDPVTLDELNYGGGEGDGQGYAAYIDSCIQGLLKESRDKFRGWVSMPISNDVDISYKKVGDGHPLRLWKSTVEVEAPPAEVLNRVLNERHVWDEDLLEWNSLEKLDDHTEVFQFVRNSLAPHPTRDFCVLRSWRSDLPKGACVLISTSIEHPRSELLGGVRAVELASRYLIEPCGTGKSRLTHISRVDIRGHSPDWYKKVYGHVCANFMKRVRASFKQSTEGPETKV